MKHAVVLDAGPLIHLDELGCLKLFAVLGELLIPLEVWTETLRHRPALRPEHLPQARLLEPAPVPSTALRERLRHFNLDEGESAALSWLETLRGGTLVSDDGEARDAARELSFSVIGTLGIIVRAGRHGLLSADETRQLFGRIRSETSLHVSERLLDELIASLPRT